MSTGFLWPVFFLRLRGRHSQKSWQEGWSARWRNGIFFSLWEDEQKGWVQMDRRLTCQSWQWECHCWGIFSGLSSRWREEGGEGGSRGTWSLWTIPWRWRQLTASRAELKREVVFYARLLTNIVCLSRPWGRLCPDAGFVSFLRLKVQLSIDTLSYQCRKGLWAVWLLKHRLRPWEVMRWKSASCHSGCVMEGVHRHRRFRVWCKNKSGGSTGYQRCNSSGILLLED